MTRCLIIAAAAFGLLSNPASAETIAVPDYPQTRAEPIVDEIFGEQVADPYRWLEGDIRNQPAVADWVERQNAVTRSFLTQLKTRSYFEEKLSSLYDFERFGTPTKAGSNYFYTRNTGLLNQDQLFVQSGSDGQRRLLIDPNAWAADGAAALASWHPSASGQLLAYTIQDGGTDWRTIKLLDVASGEILTDVVEWAKFTTIAWVGDEGFLYSRFPEPEDGADFRQLNFNHQVFFHRIGTDQSEDELVYATPKMPEASHRVSVTTDQRWVVISSTMGTNDQNEVHLIDLDKRDRQGWRAKRLIRGFDEIWQIVDSIDGKLYARTDRDAPRNRIMTLEPDKRRAKWEPLIGERALPLSSASMVGSRLVLEYLKDASSIALLCDLEGNPAGQISLGGIGTAGGFTGRAGDPETFYSFTSFNRPPSIFRLNIETGETDVFAEPDLSFDPDDFVVEQRFYSSKDGTKVPIFIVRKRDLAQLGVPAPTILYGYGGFDSSQTPRFLETRMAWLQAGGVFALANIRGGGEYGAAWHDGGRLANKQNTFDDFIAAGEFLKAEGYTPPGGLAIQGRSNGGLLVGAVTNQRPDLFSAAHAAVGVMDMLRFDRWTAGRFWVDDYGDPGREEDFRVLRAYSPYHNIRDGADYPAVLVTTADTDDRVVPAHSFKYTAALQAADAGAMPHLIRVETRAGHGSGKPTDKEIEEGADILGFLAEFTGLTPTE
ncbi:MAG: prolyl oligopeptidase family serine peptidase [Erythrobacter sp.]